ncbi:MAG: hypothetical protein C6W56_02080 [Caldibacillus debilis]|nr:MAG: hypothetical protein C6W56_02080 [Caldibacillus debilis]
MRKSIFAYLFYEIIHLLKNPSSDFVILSKMRKNHAAAEETEPLDLFSGRESISPAIAQMD